MPTVLDLGDFRNDGLDESGHCGLAYDVLGGAALPWRGPVKISRIGREDAAVWMSTGAARPARP